ncbi:MAG: hypothetical protein KatS3mg124_1658 [Porticoccaceae bacterium]|nr:MAG: hypothetical protein KatS3mg124_1658 [Porticoccaceae bacterium]
MDVREIREFLPHRYPFLLVDRVVELEPGRRILAYKNITANESVFQGHFPRVPIFPGVLIIEALAQASGILGFATVDKRPDERNLYLFAGVDGGALQAQGGAGRSLDARIGHRLGQAQCLEIPLPGQRRRPAGL